MLVQLDTYNFGNDTALGRWINLAVHKTGIPFLHLRKGQCIIERRDGKVSTIYNGDVLLERVDVLAIVEGTTIDSGLDRSLGEEHNALTQDEQLESPV